MSIYQSIPSSHMTDFLNEQKNRVLVFSIKGAGKRKGTEKAQKVK